jgi:hypothetical protein
MYNLIYLEMLNDIEQLKVLGLTEDEIEGYVEFFFDYYFPPEKKCLFN